MKRFILPFEVDVEMRMYHNKAFPLGIIKANLFDYRVWLSNKLINSVCRSKGSFDCVEEDIWSIKDGLTFTQRINIAPKSFSYKGLNLIEFNKTMIENECYLTGSYNEYYIPGKKHCKKKDFDHDYIIFGYDDEFEVFKSAAYVSDKTYSFFDITYENYYQSVVNEIISIVDVNYHKINKEYISQINIENIKRKLNNYLLSRNNNGNTSLNDVYGIDAWDLLSEYVLYTKEGLDLRFGRAYMEHKTVMINRLQVLEELAFLNNNDIVEKYQTSVFEKAQGIHNMFIKYNLTKNLDYLSLIAKEILNINNEERIIVEKVLEQL